VKAGPPVLVTSTRFRHGRRRRLTNLRRRAAELCHRSLLLRRFLHPTVHIMMKQHGEFRWCITGGAAASHTVAAAARTS